MKKFYIAMTAIAVVALVSCQQEKSFDEKSLGKDEFRIALQGAATTRSQELIEPKTFSYHAGKDEASGLEFYLEETVEDLNAAWAPATKGTPAYTENVGKLYHNMTVVSKDGTTETNTNFWAIDGQQQEGAGWRYQGTFTWAKDSYDFYMSMPENLTSNGVVSNPIYGKTDDGKLTISFDYKSPDTEDASAVGQKDIIFAARTITKGEATTNRVNGVPVLFHHALTGVKFRIANNDELEKGKEGHTQTYITKVTITGLKNSGTCTITPREETNGYVDDKTGDYSSGDQQTFTSGVVAWSYKDGTGTFSQKFTEAQNVTKYSSGTTSASGSFTNNGDYPNTFSNAGNTYNLNDGDASMTFWFIPQALTEDVKLTVEFHVWDGTKDQKTNELTLNLGTEVLKKTGNDLTLTRDWKAGQIRTFSLKPDKVDVEIDDKLTEYVKSDVTIRNTGNVAMYVRVNLLGNWVGQLQLSEDKDDLSDPTVLMGHLQKKVATGETDYQVWPWNDKDGDSGYVNQQGSNYFDESNKPSYDGSHIGYGEFIDLPALCTTADTTGKSNGHHWYRFDKYYYYALPIGPGEYMAASDVLFKSYTVGKSPTFWVADAWGERWPAQNVHLEMDVVAQSIEAKLDEDGNEISNFMEAWAKALKGENATVSVLDDL